MTRTTASRFHRTAALALALLTLAAPFDTAQAKKKGRARAAQAVGATGILDAPLRELSGPRRRVAVMKFSSRSDFLARYGLSEVGGGLAAMLTTALVESDRFTVVERTDLSEVLAEQQLGGSQMLTQESAPEIGKLTGAQLVIVGHVTEFSQSAKGKGFSFGLAKSSLGLGLSPQKREGIVGIDIRVIDTGTGEVVAGYHVRESIKARAVKVNLSVDDFSLGNHEFMKTPLGKAARAAISRAVHRFAEEVARQEWAGRVVEFEDGEIAINAGAASGVKTGDRFEIVRVSKVLTDPETGQPLGGRRRSLGNLVIADVQQGIAFGSFQPRDGAAAPRRGDLVLLPR